MVTTESYHVMMMYKSRARALDWGCALLILAWGAVLLLPGSSFVLLSSDQAILSWAPEETWGWACITVAVVQGTALIINGRMYEGMPIVRAVASVVAMFLWGQFAVAFAALVLIGIPRLPFATAAVLVFLNLYCTLRAGADAWHGRQARRGVRR